MPTGTINGLLATLRSPDENERRQAIVELLESQDPQALPLLTQLASQDPSVEIRYYARRAVETLKKSLPAAPPPAGGEGRPLADLFASPAPADRFEGLKQALRTPTPEGTALVRQGLAREEVPQLKASFLIAMGRLGGPGDVPALAAGLAAEDARVRANAVEALGTVGGDEAVRRVIPLLQDPDNRVKANVITVLKGFGGASLLELLRRMAAEDEVWMRDSALYALSCFDSPHALALVARMAARDPLERLREKAGQYLRGLADKGNQVAAELLARVAAARAGTTPETPVSPPSPPPSRPPSPPSVAEPGPVAPPRPATVAPAPPGAEAPPLPVAILPRPAEVPEKTLPAPIPAAPAPVPPPSPAGVAPAGVEMPVATGAAGLGDEIQGLLASDDPGKRQLALLKVSQGATRDPADLPLLLAALRRESEGLLLASLITLLKDFRGDGVFEAVQPFLTHADDRVRANAAETLAAIDGPAASPHLLALLEDPNNRVRANTILALAADGILDPVGAVGTMCADPREVFRRSGLYVVSSLPRPGFLPLLQTLLEDTSPRVRGLAFDVVSDFAEAGIPGAAQIKSRVEDRIRMEKGRDRFFENSFDQLFSGLLQSMAAGGGPSRARPEASPLQERQALMRLGRKAEQAGLLPVALRDRLAALAKETQRLQALLGDRERQSPPQDPGIAGQAKEASERELLRQEIKRAEGRRDSILIEAGGQVLDGAARQTAEARNRLQPELQEAEASRVAGVPTGEFSVLPAADAAIPEIFDLTMRIYQKHVVAFSLVTGGIAFGSGLVLGGGILVVALAMAVHPALGALLILPLLPVALYGGVWAHALWKVTLTLMIQRFVAGQPAPLGETTREAAGLAGPLVWVMARKYLYLAGQGVAAFFIALPVAGFLVVNNGLYGVALVRLGMLVVMAVIFGSRFFPYWLVEPDFVLQGGRPDRDPFESALQVFRDNPGRIIMLYLFASVMMGLISGTTVELFVLLTFLPLGKVVVTVVAFFSEIFLMPLVYSNAVILRLMLARGASPGRHP
ncbi:MAG: hypothetical protein GX442_17175 [Candidatus Riflebacteria bacterium]|nr:hypothetical protein [Candidatus Riflebacteria bacterium]